MDVFLVNAGLVSGLGRHVFRRARLPLVYYWFNRQFVGQFRIYGLHGR